MSSTLPSTQTFARTSICKYHPIERPDSFHYGAPMKVIVGRDEYAKEFFFHHDLLSWVSSYFRVALQKDRFKEGKEGIVRLEEDNAATVQQFSDWLYDGRILPTDFAISRSDEELGQALNKNPSLFELYVFADCRGIPLLKNDIIDTVVDRISRSPRKVLSTALVYIYDNTPSGDGMRQLLLSALVNAGYRLVSRVRKGDSLLKLEDLSLDCVLDYAAALELEVGPPSFDGKKQRREIDRCAFHDHSGHTQTAVTEAVPGAGS